MSDKVSIPILAGGEFTGRALNHINELTESKVSSLENRAFEAIARKADQATFDTFLDTVSSQISDSDARTALAGAQAAISAEQSARESADAQLEDRIFALENTEPDLSAYATKEELSSALDKRADKLTVYTGEPVSLGKATAGKMVGILATGAGTVEGVDVSPGEVWVFVGTGSQWQPYKAGGGGGASAALTRPALSVSSITDTAARVTWPPVSGADTYEGRTNGGPVEAVASPWELSGLSMVTAYSVDVRAVAGDTPGPWATAAFKTLETPPTPLELSTNATDGSIQITTFYTANDSTRTSGAAWSKCAFTKKSLPSTGFVEFTALTPPGAVRYGVGLNGGGTSTASGTIGVYIETSGQIMLTGGTYAGGVDSKSNISAGSRLRLGRSTEALYVEQKQGSNWVRLGAQAAPSPLNSTKLGIFGPNGSTWDVQAVAGAGWV